jgi:hypothetical protein
MVEARAPDRKNEKRSGSFYFFCFFLVFSFQLCYGSGVVHLHCEISLEKNMFSS